MAITQNVTEGAFLMMTPRRKDESEMSMLLKLVPAIVILGTICLTFGVAQTQIHRAQTDIDQLQASHRDDHDRVLEIKSDLRYIKERLDAALNKSQGEIK